MAPLSSRIHERTLKGIRGSADLDRAAVINRAVRPWRGEAPGRRPLDRQVAALPARVLRLRVLLEAGMEHDRAPDLIDIVGRAAEPQAPPVAVGVHLNLNTLAFVEDRCGPRRLVRVDLDALSAQLKDGHRA